MFDSVADQLRKAERIVFVTGAGISQESGIPTFRGKDGYWRKHDPMKKYSCSSTQSRSQSDS
jgi:NAD-dependent deacetylase